MSSKENGTSKQMSLVQRNPKIVVITMIVMYFLLDYVITDAKDTLHIVLLTVFTLFPTVMLYSWYVNDYVREWYPADGTDIPKFVKSKKRYAIIGWLVISLLGIIFLIAELFIVPKFFPVLNDTYYQPRILLMVFIAPVMEEIIFRYLLYDRWLKPKWGWFWGFIAASIIFVICHPVTNMHSFIVYWIPTLLFFLIYQEFGLYGSIIIHILYNMMAI